MIDSNFIGGNSKIRVYGNPYSTGNVTISVVGTRGTSINIPVSVSFSLPSWICYHFHKGQFNNMYIAAHQHWGRPIPTKV